MAFLLGTLSGALSNRVCLSMTDIKSLVFIGSMLGLGDHPLAPGNISGCGRVSKTLPDQFIGKPDLCGGNVTGTLWLP